MNENEMMNNEVVVTEENEATENLVNDVTPETKEGLTVGEKIGVGALLVSAGYGAFTAGRQIVGFAKEKIKTWKENRKDKKAKTEAPAEEKKPEAPANTEVKEGEA
ncbi:MAG: hypothetical protein J6U54_13340 [Clostridiales bacterium]|nr:hypothetical protein [Clostridiales bacterium]